MNTTMMKRMKNKWQLSLLFCFLFAFSPSLAQVRVTVNNKFDPMPPAAMQYADDPGRFFMVTLRNTTNQPLNVFLGIELEMVGDNRISLHTPVKFSPSKGVTLMPNSTKVLTPVELKQLFYYMKLSDVSINGAIMSNFVTGKQPLLPEGQYRGRVVVYEVDYQAERPRVLSDPSNGMTRFWICYNAKAPQIVQPNTTNSASSLLVNDFTRKNPTPITLAGKKTETSIKVVSELANVLSVDRDPVTMPTLSKNTPTLDTKNPIISWMAPSQKCSGARANVTYSLEIARLLNGQSPEEALRYNSNIMLRTQGIATTQYLLPNSIVTQMRNTGGYFVARVRAVTKAGQNNPRLNNFVLIENDGYGPLCIFKVEKKTVKPPPVIPPVIPDKPDPKEEEDDDKDVPTFLVSKPHLKTPQPSIAVDTRILHTGDSILLEWQKPTLVKGNDKARFEKLTFKYNVRLFKYKTGQPLDSMLVTEPIFKHELKESDLKNGLRDTIRWNKMEKALERSEQLYVMVDATIENDNEAKIDASDKKNIAKLAYLKSAGETFGDCNPGYAETISDKTLGNFTQADLKGKEVKIGEFTMIVDEIEKTKIGKEDTYKGTGYVIWKPYGKGFKISVEFDSLWINANKEAYRGKVRSSREPKALNKQIKDKIPYDMFDDLDLILGAGKSKEYADKYADKLAGKLESYYKAMNEATDMFSLVTADGFANLELPVALPRTSKDNPVSIQLFSAEFSPNTAWINVFAQMAVPECSQIESRILAFTAPRICITPDAPLTDGIASLMGDFTFKDPKTNFGFTFRSPSQFNKPDDGTWISWSTNKTKKEMQMDSVQVQIEMSLNGLLKDDGKGGTVKGEVPVARMRTRLKEWGNWMALAEVEPFQSKELPGYTFEMTNGGMWYDHSEEENPKAMKLPKDKGYKDNALKDDKQWQGFWLKQARVMLPFDKGKDDKNKSNKRVSFSIDELFVDKHGFTVDFNANDLGKLKESGWSISLDHAYARVVQNSFKNAGIKGKIEMPVFDEGSLPYEAKMSLSNEEFLMELSVKPEKELAISAWRIKTTLDPASRINMKWGTKQGFTIGALLSGSLSLDVGERAGAYIPNVTFKNMYIANYDMLKENASLGDSESDENTESRTAGSKNNFYCSIGDWGLKGGIADMASTDYFLNSQPDYLLAHGPSPSTAPLSPSDDPIAKAEVGGFKVTLDKVSFVHKNNFSNMGIYVKAGGSLFYDQVTAKLGMKVWAKMNWDTYKLTYDDVKFNDIEAKGKFGGVCEVEGSLTALEEKGENGWKADLKLNMRELFKMTAAGKFSKVKDSKHGTYHSFALALGMQSETGIPIGVVTIDSIGGGFYYNSKLDMTASYGTCAFAMGVGMKTTGSSNLMNGKLDGLIIYNYDKKSLSKIRFDGKVHALCGTNRNKGLINANVMVEYNNDQTERAFRMMATVQGGVDDNDLIAQCKSFVGNDSKFQKLCDKAAKMNDMANNKLDQFGIGSGDKNKSTEKTKDRKSIENKGEIKASAGLQLSFDFAVVHKKAENKTKWHVYIGEPARDKRCTLTLIDFQLGKKDAAVAAWCRIYANAYVCLGNELPNDGAIPGLPEKVEDYLFGKNNKDNKNVEGNNGTAAAAKKKRQEEFNKITTASGNSPGGVMFGAEAGGEFGINAVLCYARADLVAGFDVAMLFARDMQCSDGKPAGKNGYYCNGQVYGYAGGQLGLMIKTRLWTGKFPIVDAGIGALLKGGFVNPTWVYGKLKAHCKLLGGLIKFKSTIEVKAGSICLPVAKNPLEDIKIFGGADPGSDNKSEGWDAEKAVSVFTRINFSTNMAIGADLRLLDENIAIQQAGVSGDAADYAKNAERVFRFTLNNTMPLYIHRTSGSKPSTSGTLVGNYNHQSIAGKNNTEFYMKIGPAVLEPEEHYSMVLTGRGYEIVNGVQKNPLSLDTEKMKKGIREEWKDTYTFYFRTGPLSTNLKDYVQFSFPADGTTCAPMDEAKRPKLVLKRDISSFMNNSDYEYLLELEEYNSSVKDFVKVQMSDKTSPKIEYKSNSPYYHIDVRRSNLTGYYYPFNEIKAGKKYRYVFYRYRKADMNNAINALKAVYKKTVLAQPSGNYDAKGNKVNSANLTATYKNSTVDGVKLSADGKSVIVTGDDGKTYSMPLDTHYESISKVIEDYNKDFDKSVGGEDNRERKINEMVKRKIKKEAYMDRIYAITFTPSEYTLDEMARNRYVDLLKKQERLYTQFIDQEGRGTNKNTLKASDYYQGKRPQAVHYASGDVTRNPYDFLNYMSNFVFLHGVTLKQGYFYPNNITSAQGLGLKFTNPDLRGGIVNGSDGSWHGTIFEANLNVRRMQLGDNLYEVDIPHTYKDSHTNKEYFTGPVDVKRRIPLQIAYWSYYHNGSKGMMEYPYYAVLLYDSWLAWRVDKAVRHWADIYWQYYNQKSGQKEQRQWVELLQGTTTSVKGSYSTTIASGKYNVAWKAIKNFEGVGSNGIKSSGYCLLPTLQYPTMQGLWNQYKKESNLDDRRSYNPNAVIKLESLTTAKGWENRDNTTSWELLNGGIYKTEYNKYSKKYEVWLQERKPFDWQAYLKGIEKFRYAVYKPNAYNTVTGEDAIRFLPGIQETSSVYPVITVSYPFRNGWTMPTLNEWDW